MTRTSGSRAFTFRTVPGVWYPCSWTQVAPESASASPIASASFRNVTRTAWRPSVSAAAAARRRQSSSGRSTGPSLTPYQSPTKSTCRLPSRSISAGSVMPQTLTRTPGPAGII